MKKYLALFIFLFAFQSLAFSNPVDYAPIAKFSELVLEANDKWTMEVYFPPLISHNLAIDSIVIQVKEVRSRLLTKSGLTFPATIISSDSLSRPIHIDNNGDKVLIFTYSTIIGPQEKLVRKDSLIFGNYPDATVDKPSKGYSIARVNLWRPNKPGTYNYVIYIDPEKRLNDSNLENNTLRGTLAFK
ncbi:MAG: hypothetical protein Q8933_21615 [Bacteroidota bacterium]|nr:hypothetical protein [Bacteroidota bacterium]MDP4191935.1 hypothetical protein [Bacteroidota bacterium]MDP4197677.1 hypothetical protein [Bacteroidota bacterium]